MSLVRVVRPCTATGGEATRRVATRAHACGILRAIPHAMDAAALRDELLRRAHTAPDAPATSALLTRVWSAARGLAPPAASAWRGFDGGLRTRSDEDLLRDFTRGDADAFEELATRHLPKLKGYALRYLAESDAEDAVQDALMVALRDASTLTGPSAFARYVFRSLTFEIRERRRRAARASAREEALDETAHEVADGDDLADAAFVRRQSVGALAEALLACLDPFDQQLLLLWFEGDETASRAEEVGGLLGMGAGAVRVRKCRALKKLREWFDTREGRS